MSDSLLNPMDLTGHAFLVTGASSGIGRDLCVLLSELGADVILTGRDQGRLDETLSLMREGDHRSSPLDLSSSPPSQEWLQEIVGETTALSGFVHSAGVSPTQALRYWEEEDHQQVFDINVTAAVHLSKLFRHPSIKKQGVPKIVFISSVAGLLGFPGMVSYCASKAALIGAARSLAVELARQNIRVNCVCPGLVTTEMTEGVDAKLGAQPTSLSRHLLGMGKARDVSNLVAFLLSPAADWITGQSFVVDGGCTL